MRILIIEDDVKIAQILKEGLEKEGYAVDHLPDGESGQRRIEMYRTSYDIVILDLMLPKKGGLEVCREIREMSISVPILVLTAKDSIEDKTNLLNAGADDYLVKPFSFQELLARIRAVQRRQKGVASSKLKVRNLVLDTAERKAFVGNKEMKLTLKEFVLLEYFMRHPNQAVKREEIVEDLWDFDFDSFSNIIDVHVNNLRKKINHRDRGEFIETIRGVGYRIKSEF